MNTSERTHIEQAIEALEAHRDLLGDGVADTTLWALQEQLAVQLGLTSDDSLRPTPQRKQITTMFANITGLASLTGSQQDSDLLDMARALWRRMDRAITEQGGMIDKHVADGVMGLFGVPVAHEDDPERAVRAALAVQSVLDDFVTELTASGDAVFTDWAEPSTGQQHHLFQQLELRIGINTGPVLLGKVGSGEEYTVIGAAVNLASRLERVAPAGAILISHDTYSLIQGIFDVESLPPIEIKGIGDRVAVYRVRGANPRSSQRYAWGVKGISTQLVGRSKEMEQLQKALQIALRTGVGHAIWVSGEAGLGKSRLLYEFTRWLDTLPEEIITLKGRADQQMSQQPYSLIRDLLTTHFGIQGTDQVMAVENKLTSGMRTYMELSELEARGRANTIGQFIGLSVASDMAGLASQSEAPQMRARVFDYLVEFFEAVAARCAALLVILEDMHWADPQSQQFIAHLAHTCQHAPLLLVSLARPQPVEEGAEFSALPPATAAPLAIELSHLSDDECRELVLDILRRLPVCPEELCHLIVSRADGNPFYVEEMIKVLIEDGVIVAGDQEWRVVPNRFSSVRVPPTLTGVLQARLDRLSPVEQVTLQRAAVIGRMFWDSALIHISETAHNAISAADVRAGLRSLTKRELIFQSNASGFANTEAYAFKHAFLRDVTYESVLLRDRPVYHKLTADWLAERSGDRMVEYAPLIAEHYEKAGEQVAAAELYELAAARAQEMYNPQVAIDYYQRAFALLQDEPLQAVLRVTLYERLGSLLRSQARLLEASQVYRSMHHVAEQDGNLVAQARAQIGLAICSREQANFTEMQQRAAAAQQIAWLVSADEELIQALQLIGKAHHRLERHDQAVAAAQQALELSERLELVVPTSLTLQLLATIHLETGNDVEAYRQLQLLEQQQAALSESADTSLEKALATRLLAELYGRLGQLDKATFLSLEALETYRKNDFQQEIAGTLSILAEIAVRRDDPAAAQPLYQEAIAIANSIGDEYNAMFYRAQLASVLNLLGEYDGAKQLVQRVTQIAADVTRFSQWIGTPSINLAMAEARLGLGETGAALEIVLQAQKQTVQWNNPIWAGTAWWLLGKIARHPAPQAQAIASQDRPYSPERCFSESMRVLNQVNGDRFRLLQARQRTLTEWIAYEQHIGNQEKVRQLQVEAKGVTSQLARLVDSQPVSQKVPQEDLSGDVTE